MKTFIYSWNRNKSNSTWKFIENSSEARQKAIEEGATDFSILSFEYEPTTERPHPLRFGDLFIDFDSKKSPFLAIKEMYLFHIKTCTNNISRNFIPTINFSDDILTTKCTVN